MLRIRIRLEDKDILSVKKNRRRGNLTDQEKGIWIRIRIGSPDTVCFLIASIHGKKRSKH